MIVIHFWIPTFGLAINFSYNLCLVAQFSGCHLQVGRGIVLFAAGFGQSVSRGSQGVGDSLLIPERDKKRAKGRGERSLLTYNRWKKLREEIGEKHASFCYFFF